MMYLRMKYIFKKNDLGNFVVSGNLPIKFGVLIFVALLTQKLCAQSYGGYDVVNLGDKCPQFTLTTVDGKDIITTDSLKGSIVIINFFATWCSPCLRELPELNSKIWKKYNNRKDFKVLTIGRGHNSSELEVFKRKMNYDFPMYADSSKVVYDSFAKQYIPRNYILNKEGTIVFSSINYTEFEFMRMQSKIEELLK